MKRQILADLAALRRLVPKYRAVVTTGTLGKKIAENAERIDEFIRSTADRLKDKSVVESIEDLERIRLRANLFRGMLEGFLLATQSFDPTLPRGAFPAALAGGMRKAAAANRELLRKSPVEKFRNPKRKRSSPAAKDAEE